MEIKHCKIHFLISNKKKVVLLETKIKNNLHLLHYSQDWWPHTGLIMTRFFPLAERKENVSFSSPSLSVPSLSEEMYKSISFAWLWAEIRVDRRKGIQIRMLPTSVFFSLPKRNCNVSVLWVQKNLTRWILLPHVVSCGQFFYDRLKFFKLSW